MVQLGTKQKPGVGEGRVGQAGSTEGAGVKGGRGQLAWLAVDERPAQQKGNRRGGGWTAIGL